MTDKQPEALIRADELEAIGAESSLARAMAAHTIRLLYKENEALRARLDEWERVNMHDHKEGDLGIGTTPYAAQAAMVAQQTQGRMYVDPVTGDVGIGNPNQVTLDTSGATTFSLTPIDWDASARPQREWKGLTDEELLDIADMAYANDLELLQTLQAKLKEKNHG